MSSSDEDVEYFDASPVAQEPVRRGNRRKAHTPSPRKVPRKKQREVLADFNLEVPEDSDDGEEMEAAARPKRKVVHQGKRKRGEVSSTDSNVEEEDGRRASTSSEMENMPPPPKPSAAAILADNIPEESSQPVNNGEGQVRPRKRLSIRAETAVDGRRSSIGNGTESVLATPSEVQTIYETCSQMFNSNKINAHNAFNLRLLDCINQMINSPAYDKSNMILTSSTVEIGTRIYVCRVENTYSQVKSLASDVVQQHKRKLREAGEDGENAEGQGDEGGMDEMGDDGAEDGGRRQRQRRKVVKKRGKYVEEDNKKLLTGLEEQNVKFVTRRNLLKKKFNDMINNDLEFEYLNYFLEPEDEHPLQTENEMKAMQNSLKIPDVYVDSNNLGQLKFQEFHYVQNWDPETYNIWGTPLKDVEEMRDAFSDDPLPTPANDEFAYDPANRPAEYPDEGMADNLMNDTLGEALPFGDGNENGIPAVSFHDIRSLDHLENYFQKVRNLLKTSKSKYGWCGPNFVRPKSTWPTQKQAKKPRVRKEPEPIDFSKIDWTDKANKFNPGQAGRTVFDDKVIESWSTKKTAIPFLGIEITSYDDDFDPLDFQNENDPNYVPMIFKLFTSRNRSILDLLKSSEQRHRNSSGGSFPPPHIPDDDGFDNDHDIELPRDVAEDFCSQPMEGGSQEGANQGATPGDAWAFPGSVPGLLKDDPLSLVSGIDSIRFNRQPKPIVMSDLKNNIVETLKSNLKLDPKTAQPLQDNETKMDLADLMLEVLKQSGRKTERVLSVPIFVVALMHVVVDKRLFLVYDDSDPDCPVVVCRGKNFNHADHIPMPVDGLDHD